MKAKLRQCTLRSNIRKRRRRAAISQVLEIMTQIPLKSRSQSHNTRSAPVLGWILGSRRELCFSNPQAHTVQITKLARIPRQVGVLELKTGKRLLLRMPRPSPVLALTKSHQSCRRALSFSWVPNLIMICLLWKLTQVLVIMSLWIRITLIWDLQISLPSALVKDNPWFPRVSTLYQVREITPVLWSTKTLNQFMALEPVAVK